MKISYQEFKDAINTLELIGLETKRQVKLKYLKLSKIYHPDTINGNNNKFQQLNQAYKIVEEYMNNYKFQFSKEEFEKQYPFSMKKDGSWSLW